MSLRGDPSADPRAVRVRPNYEASVLPARFGSTAIGDGIGEPSTPNRPGGQVVVVTLGQVWIPQGARRDSTGVCGVASLG